MADPVVNYTAVPVSGSAPLTVVITLISVFVDSSELDPFSIAHEGFYNNTDQLFDPFQMSHFGYYQTAPNIVFLWKFGDGGSTSAINPGSHTYVAPGDYILRLCLAVDGIVFEYPTDIRVEAGGGGTYDVPGGDYGVPGIGQAIGQAGGPDAGERISLTYGNDETQGIGWSTNSGDGHIWPDSPGSVISIFNEEDDHEQILIDSLDGLPYTFDGRKIASSSLIFEVWKDRVNPLEDDSGTEITTRIRLAEYRGSHESYRQQMSDIYLYFQPMYRSDQGATGFTEKGLRDAFQIDLELYSDEKLENTAHADNVPLDRELFFDRKINGHIMQLAFETAASQFRFTRSEVYLTNYDQALWGTKPEMTEKTHQDRVGELIGWYSRGGFLFERISRTETPYTGTAFTVRLGPDNYTGSVFLLLGPDLDVTFRTFDMTYWSTDETAITTDLASTSTTIGQVIVPDPAPTTWFFVHIKLTAPLADTVYTLIGNLLVSPSYFDVRFHKSVETDPALTTDQLNYMFTDVTENQGNAICPSWF